jgi:hypothetical protein
MATSPGAPRPPRSLWRSRRALSPRSSALVSNGDFGGSSRNESGRRSGQTERKEMLSPASHLLFGNVFCVRFLCTYGIYKLKKIIKKSLKNHTFFFHPTLSLYIKFQVQISKKKQNF